MSFWTSKSLRAATGGAWVRKPDDEGAPSEFAGLGTDTRTLKPGQVFLALRGEHFDGHDFLTVAASAGASMLIVDEPDTVPAAIVRAQRGPAVLRVKDTRRALAQLGAACRASLDSLRVVAVCGSNGKTTTTRLIHAILSTRLRGSASPRSFNNEIGVPLTVLAARPGDQYLVCEVGTNHPGEIARLARIVQPDIAVITSIGRAHMEHFESVEAVAREDAAVLVDLRAGGTAIVPDDAPTLADFLRPVPHVVTFGAGPDADLRISGVEHTQLPSGQTGLRLMINERQWFDAPLLGRHNARNIAAAIGVARRLGLDDDSIRQGLASFTPGEMRLQRRTVRGVDLLVDCYNANPESMLAALETFTDLSQGARRRVLILGDMLELGDFAERCHEEAGEAACRLLEPTLVVTVGQNAIRIAERVQRAHPRCKAVMLSELDDDSAQRIAERLQPGDSVLLKGSRGTRLERIITALERSRERSPAVHPAA